MRGSRDLELTPNFVLGAPSLLWDCRPILMNGHRGCHQMRKIVRSARSGSNSTSSLSVIKLPIRGPIFTNPPVLIGEIENACFEWARFRGGSQTGKSTRNFSKSSYPADWGVQLAREIQAFVGQIPYATKEGIFFSRSGNYRERTAKFRKLCAIVFSSL